MSKAKEEFLSSTTSDKEKYIRNWKEYVNQLARLAYPLINASKAQNEYYAELLEIQSRLNQLIQIAANEDFKE